MWIKSERKSLPEYLKEITKTAAYQGLDWFMTDGQATGRFKPYKVTLLQEGLTQARVSKYFKKGTITQYLLAHNRTDECIKWLKVKCSHKGFYSKAGRLFRTFIH